MCPDSFMGFGNAPDLTRLHKVAGAKGRGASGFASLRTSSASRINAVSGIPSNAVSVACGTVAGAVGLVFDVGFMWQFKGAATRKVVGVTVLFQPTV